jgi:L-ascorbate metabolism protein UlaG (beta-lactamase superfamily)
MRFKFLGTGAADWAKPSDGFFRANACALIDGSVMIDGTLRALERLDDPAAVTDILYTHSHADHFDPALLGALAPVRAHAHKSWAGEIDVPGVAVVPFDTLSDFEVRGLRVTALPSNHSTERAYETTVHFVVRGGGRSLFYATDGAWLLNAEWHALLKEELDAAVFDATVGEMYPSDFRIFEHNTVGMVRLIARMLKNPMNGINPVHGYIRPVLKSDAKVYLTHLARTLHPSHEEVEKSCAGEFVVAYDGLEVEI